MFKEIEDFEARVESGRRKFFGRTDANLKRRTMERFVEGYGRKDRDYGLFRKTIESMKDADIIIESKQKIQISKF